MASLQKLDPRTEQAVILMRAWAYHRSELKSDRSYGGRRQEPLSIQ